MLPVLLTAPPPPPPAAIERTIEEIQIEQPIIPSAAIVDKILTAADDVLDQFTSGDKKPDYNGTVFTAAARINRCQQNIRNLVEASDILGEENEWEEASCCATNTMHLMHLAAKNGKYLEIKNFDEVQPGDLIYLGGGGCCCSACGRLAGHVMVYTGDNALGQKMMWQNTSLHNKKLCEIPITENQKKRFVAAYRFMEETKTIIINKITVRVKSFYIVFNELKRGMLPPSPYKINQKYEVVRYVKKGNSRKEEN